MNDNKPKAKVTKEYTKALSQATADLKRIINLYELGLMWIQWYDRQETLMTHDKDKKRIFTVLEGHKSEEFFPINNNQAFAEIVLSCTDMLGEGGICHFIRDAKMRGYIKNVAYAKKGNVIKPKAWG